MRWLLAVALGLVVVGCGVRQVHQKPAMPAVQTTCVEGVNCGGTAKTYRHCTSVVNGFRACTAFPPDGTAHSRIERRAASAWTTVLRPSEAPAHGWWRRVLPSPDRKTLLGQWSGDCELQTTYMIRVGGRPRPIFSEAESFALGWSDDGRARVQVPITAKDVRGDVRSGIYRIHPRTLAHTTERLLPQGSHC
jgi:hypothetical protein